MRTLRYYDDSDVLVQNPGCMDQCLRNFVPGMFGSLPKCVGIFLTAPGMGSGTLGKRVQRIGTILCVVTGVLNVQCLI